MAIPLNDCIDGDGRPVDPSLTIPNVVFDNQSVVSGAQAIAAIEANWDPPTNPFVIGIEFEWTKVGNTASRYQQFDTTTGNTHWQTTDGIAPSSNYDCRWRAIGHAAVGEWSAPETITTLANVTWYDLRGFLEAMPKNLWRFDHFIGENGATVEGSFPTAPIAFGDSGMANVLPGSSPTAAIRRTDTKGRYDEDRFAKYCMSFLAWVTSGTAVLTLSLVADGTTTPLASGVSIEGVATSSKTFNLTTTPTVYTMEFIRGSSAAFIISDWLFWNNSGWSGAQDVKISDRQLFYALDEVPDGWRPSIDEDNLLYHSELIQERMIEWREAHPNQTMSTTALGDSWTYRPHGAADLYQLEANYQLQPADAGGYLWSEEATDLDVLFPNDSTWNAPPRTVVALSKRSTGDVNLVEDTGVTVVPNTLATLTISTQGDTWQVMKVGPNLWHVM